MPKAASSETAPEIAAPEAAPSETYPGAASEGAVSDQITLAEFQSDLLKIKEGTGLSLRDLGAQMMYSHSTVARLFRGPKLPSWNLVETFLRHTDHKGEDILLWKQAYFQIQARQNPLPPLPRPGFWPKWWRWTAVAPADVAAIAVLVALVLASLFWIRE
ncbi:hypothetical protein [Actinomadura sp. 6N118]|uniref:hypothetical protein n=1 Tax=Actinomadura sp. 6N118 TaxID=3375151 RepID=UPI00379DAB52